MGNDEIKNMRNSAKMTVTGFVATAVASCAVPIPVADAFILIGEQVAMMGAICAIYKLDIKKKTLQALVLGALGASGASVVGKTIVSSAFKFIPGIGSIVGSTISAGTAGVLTLALGKAFIEVCEAIKKGELSEDDLKGKKGTDFFKDAFNVSKSEEEGKYSNNVPIEERMFDDCDEKVVGMTEEKNIDFLKISFPNLEGMDRYDSNAVNSVNILYDKNLIGNITFAMKKCQGSEKKAVLMSATIKKEYRGKHIFSYAVKQISNMYPIEITVKRFPEYEDMAKHLLRYDNVLAGK